MLVVKVEVWPGGDETRRFPIAMIRLANRSNLSDLSDYEGYAMESGSQFLGIAESTKHIFIKGHKRKQSVFPLIEKALEAMKSAPNITP